MTYEAVPEARTGGNEVSGDGDGGQLAADADPEAPAELARTLLDVTPESVVLSVD